MPRYPCRHARPKTTTATTSISAASPRLRSSTRRTPPPLSRVATGAPPASSRQWRLGPHTAHMDHEPGYEARGVPHRAHAAVGCHNPLLARTLTRAQEQERAGPLVFTPPPPTPPPRSSNERGHSFSRHHHLCHPHALQTSVGRSFSHNHHLRHPHALRTGMGARFHLYN